MVVAETTTEAAECVSCTHDDRIAELFCSSDSRLDRCHSLALDGFNVDFVEFLDEEFTVFGVHDSLYRRTEHLDVVFFKDTFFVELDATVESSLTAECEQNTVRAFLFDYLLNEVRSDREEVDLVGKAFACLHGSNVRVDQDSLDVFFLHCLESLRAAIVEFACFANLQCT